MLSLIAHSAPDNADAIGVDASSVDEVRAVAQTHHSDLVVVMVMVALTQKFLYQSWVRHE